MNLAGLSDHNRHQMRFATAPVLDRRSRYCAGGILSQIGNTPLLDLSDFAHRCGVRRSVGVYAKAEWLNPGGSVKSRAALRIVEDAMRSGRLGRGKTLIDSSSGNTGIAFALIGASLGFPVELVMPANVSIERKALVRAYGAKLIESDPLEGSDGAIRKVRELVAAEPETLLLRRPVQQPRQLAGALRHNRTGDLAADARQRHALRRRSRHERHVCGRGTLPQAAVCRTSN